MALAQDLCGTDGPARPTPDPLGDDPGMWHYGWLFSQALTIGGGTGDVQRNIVAERVLGLPHDIDVEVGQTWAEARRRSRDARRPHRPPHRPEPDQEHCPMAPKNDTPVFRKHQKVASAHDLPGVAGRHRRAGCC